MNRQERQERQEKLETEFRIKDQGFSIFISVCFRVFPRLNRFYRCPSAFIGGFIFVSLGVLAVQLLFCFSFVSFMSFVVQDRCLLSVANGFLLYY